MTPPTLHTQRLTLRAPVMADFPAYAAFWASERAVHMGGPKDVAGAWFWFCHEVAQWPLLGHGSLMVDHTAGGQTVGLVGLNGGPKFPEVELGWLVYEGHAGQGYATEAAGALRDWAFDNLGVESLVSYTDADNTASIRVAQRLGAVLDASAVRSDPQDLVWRHARRMQ
ncbi:GNAT family N-acetyltransferase [Pseudotabrizicola algicola]|uniref:GNAT family N-acetyltransferase n=1 Tax=Pseudotabrizicola algicola TaxID=2709381 RepID=A0A6B3RX41_9RHOB|nr:GNAT family N-acetyltransferase [Pseudotabrizicola algicola]NEX47682.1 GNAT family N-acetyltransferase [Pseudotabrizicola algicola]